jgi:hypothetical protein
VFVQTSSSLLQNASVRERLVEIMFRTGVSRLADIKAAFRAILHRMSSGQSSVASRAHLLELMTLIVGTGVNDRELGGHVDSLPADVRVELVRWVFQECEAIARLSRDPDMDPVVASGACSHSVPCLITDGSVPSSLP